MDLEQELLKTIRKLSVNSGDSSKIKLQKAMEYSVVPAGKLFRPNLALAMYRDFGKYKDINSDILHYCAFLEFHHAYSLVHDDLPSMDDDDFRRGRPSTHKVYGEWMGILTGDALLSASFECLTKIKHQKAMDLLKFGTWALGPKGLILGQVYDLSGQINESIQDLLTTHLLKTGRLIQCSLLGGYVLATGDYSYLSIKRYLRMGKSLGLVFQLIDDLSELADAELGAHEQEINHWMDHSKELSQILQKNLAELQESLEEGHTELKKVLQGYFKKMKAIIEDGQTNIKNQLGKDQEELVPIISLLQRLS